MMYTFYILNLDYLIHLNSLFELSKVYDIGFQSLAASTLLHQLVLSIELGTVQTGTGKVDPARKFKCTTAARGKCPKFF